MANARKYRSVEAVAIGLYRDELDVDTACTILSTFPRDEPDKPAPGAGAEIMFAREMDDVPVPGVDEVVHLDAIRSAGKINEQDFDRLVAALNLTDA